MKEIVAQQDRRSAPRGVGIVILAALFVLSLSDVHSSSWTDAASAALSAAPCSRPANDEAQIGPACSALTPDHPPALLKSSGQCWFNIQTGALLVRPRVTFRRRSVAAPAHKVGTVAEPSLARAPPG